MLLDFVATLCCRNAFKRQPRFTLKGLRPALKNHIAAQYVASLKATFPAPVALFCLKARKSHELMCSMTVQKFMQSQLKKRQEKNPKFSLRSFARLLKTDPSSLSKILNGLRIPSNETVEKWVDCLKLSSEETEALKSAVTETHSFNPLNADFFESTYSWVHPILLEALKLPNTSRNLPMLAELFGMSVEKIEQTISFLESHQILQKNLHGPGYTTSNLTTVQIPYTSDLRRNLQKKYLEMAQKALEEIPLEKRDNSTLTVAIHTDDIPAMKDIIREARLKIHRLAEKRKHQLNAVYNFSSALYPVNEETL